MTFLFPSFLLLVQKKRTKRKARPIWCRTVPLLSSPPPNRRLESELDRTLSVEKQARRYESFLWKTLCRVGARDNFRKWFRWKISCGGYWTSPLHMERDRKCVNNEYWMGEVQNALCRAICKMAWSVYVEDPVPIAATKSAYERVFGEHSLLSIRRILFEGIRFHNLSCSPARHRVFSRSDHVALHYDQLKVFAEFGREWRNRQRTCLTEFSKRWNNLYKLFGTPQKLLS